MYYQHVMAFLQENTKITRFDIATRMGISVHDLVLISLGKIKPTDEQVRIFNELLSAVRTVFSLPAQQAYSREEGSRYEQQFKEAETVFASSEDKELYRSLIAHRKGGSSDLHRFLHYAREPHHHSMSTIL